MGFGICSVFHIPTIWPVSFSDFSFSSNSILILGIALNFFALLSYFIVWCESDCGWVEEWLRVCGPKESASKHVWHTNTRHCCIHPPQNDISLLLLTTKENLNNWIFNNSIQHSCITHDLRDDMYPTNLISSLEMRIFWSDIVSILSTTMTCYENHSIVIDVTDDKQSN